MRALKEPISRRANAEDECSGAFFASRYRCRRVEDAEGLLAVGLYTDLRLFRAGECPAPWESRYCSAGLRHLEIGDGMPPQWLANFTLLDGQSDEAPSASGRRATDCGCLPIPFDQYLPLLMWEASRPPAGQATTLPRELAEIIERQGLHPQRLSDLLQELPALFPRVIGTSASLRQRAARQNRHWFHGVGQADQFFRD
jgi:hypothetical protein